MSEEHGGPRPPPETEGSQSFYRAERDNPYPPGHVYRERWQAGYDRAAQHEHEWRQSLAGNLKDD